jgi:tetratricopeptide (TPR) repeat protein
VVDARQYVFVHALMRDVAYGQIPRASRADRHRRAAAWIESLSAGRSEDRAEVLAHHLVSAIELGTAAGGRVDDLRGPATRALREAGDRASALASPRAAARFYARAIEIAADDEPDPELLFLLGRARINEGTGEGEEDLQRAAEGLIARGQRGLAAEALVNLYDSSWNAARSQDELLERARELVADEGSTYSRGYVVATIGRFYNLGGRPEDAIPLDEEAIAIAEELGDRELLVYALTNLGTARCASGDYAGLSDIERSLEIGLGIGSGDVTRAYTNIGSITESLGDVTRAEEVHRAGVEAALRVENAVELRWLQSELVYDWYRLGRWDDAFLAIAQLPVNRAEPRYMDGVVVAPGLLMAEARGSRPSLDDVEWLAGLGEAIGDPQVLLPALCWAARLAEAAGEAEHARRYLQEVARHGTGVAPGWVGGWVYDAAITAVRLGMATELSPLVRLGTRSRYEEAATLLLDGKPGDAADVLAQIPSVLDEADARVLAAEAEPEGAVEKLERALAIYRQLGATARIARAEALLIELGQRAV